MVAGVFRDSLLIVTGCFLVPLASAQDGEGPLAARGIAFSARYFAEALGNVSGGRKTGVVYDGLLYLSLDLDLEKLTGWTGASFHADGYNSHGRSVTGKLVGDLGYVSSLDLYDGSVLSEFWFEQHFFEKRFSMRVGQLALDGEFMSSRYAQTFINASFGLSNALAYDVPASVFGSTALGARLLIAPTQHFYLQFAAYDGNPAPAVYRDLSPDAVVSREFNRHGTQWALRGDEGALLIAEVCVKTNPPEDARGLSGTYKAGVFYHTDTFSDVYDGTLAALGSSLSTGAVRGIEGNFGAYLLVDQELWREPGTKADGLGFFARAVFAPRGRSLVDFSGEAGLVYEGLWQADAADALGIGFAWIKMSPRVRAAVRDANLADGLGVAEPDYEAVVELTYRFQAAAWWTVQPHVQWIAHPGGSGALDDAVIIGLRTSVGF
jgi:porin